MARDLGFALAAVTAPEPPARGEYLRQWLAADKHGEMHYLAEHVEVLLDPDKLLAGARAVICVADVYPAAAGATSDHDSPHGRVARYAWGEDYHQVIKRRLFALADALREQWPQHRFRAAVDTAPVMERDFASRAGLGWIGKHTLVIHPRLGSWLLLGEIFTTLPIDLHEPPAVMADHCGTCRRCIDACPTQCISDDGYQLDASRCVSYLTIEHRGAIDPTLHAAMGDWIAGCDICQEVCPFNRSEPEIVFRPEYAERLGGSAINLLEALHWDAAARQAALRKSALKRIKLDMFKRNALIAAGNHLAKNEDAALRRRIEQLAQDESESDLVRATARQALTRLAATDT